MHSDAGSQFEFDVIHQEANELAPARGYGYPFIAVCLCVYVLIIGWRVAVRAVGRGQWHAH